MSFYRFFIVLLGLGLTLTDETPLMAGTATLMLSAGQQPILLAQATRNRARKNFGKRKRKKKPRVRHLTGEKTVTFKKGQNKTNIDFDAARIDGSRKVPLGVMVERNRSNNEHDFVWIRKKWHPEMVRSANSLDSK